MTPAFTSAPTPDFTSAVRGPAFVIFAAACVNRISRYQIEKKAAVFTAAVHSVGVRLEVYPYLAEDIEETARIKAGAGHTVGVRVDIYPHVYRKMGADWRALCAAYIQQTGKLEIFPQNRTEA